MVEHFNGLILEGKPIYVSYKKVSQKKIDSKIQPSKEADIPEPPKKQRFIQDCDPRGTPSCREENEYQELHDDETGRKARAEFRRPAGYYAGASSQRGKLLGITNSSSSFAESVRPANIRNLLRMIPSQKSLKNSSRLWTTMMSMKRISTRSSSSNMKTKT